MRRAPDDWPDVATLIDNNYRNMHARDVKTKGREAADEESVPFLGATLPTVLFQFLDVHIVSVCRLTDLDPVMEEYASRVAYCIPILANAAVTYDVSIQQTPEMQKEAGSIGWHLCALPGAESILCGHMRNHLIHVCSAPLGQASRRVRDPVPECFI